MENQKKEIINKEQQQHIINLINDDNINEAIKEIDNYFLFDKYTFRNLRKDLMSYSDGTVKRKLVEQLKIFVRTMHEPPEPNKKTLAEVSEKVILPVTTFILGVLSIIIGHWGELIQPEIYKILKDTLGEYCMTVMVSTGIILVGISFFLTFWKKDKKKQYLPKRQELEQNQRKKFIEKLEVRFQQRLDQKLDSRLSLPLDFEEVDEKRRADDELFFNAKRTIGEERNKLAELANKFPFILILGKPGSGKSSRLLDLAMGLLEKAKNNEQAAIPAIFNLAA